MFPLLSYSYLLFLLTAPVNSLLEQSVGIKGRLTCGNTPLQRTNVKLWDQVTLGRDRLLNETNTDQSGSFTIQGHGSSFFGMNVYFKVYHNCEDEYVPCLRKVSLGIPSSFVTRTPRVISYFDAGTMNMAFKYPREERLMQELEETENVAASRKKHLNDLGIRLANAQSNNPMHIFKALREFAIDLETKEMDLKTERSFIEQSLPEKLALLKRQKDELISLRDDVVSLRDHYLEDASNIVNLLKKQSPEILQMMEDVSNKQKRLTNLELCQEYDSLIANCKSMLDAGGVSSITSAFAKIRDMHVKAKEFGSGVSSAQTDKFAALTSAVKTFYKDQLGNRLEKIRYPFEDPIDCRSFGREISDIVEILCIANEAEINVSESRNTTDLLSHLMFEPLSKRFQYHFYGDRKTNDFAKPEWFFTQALSWIQTCLPFFTSIFASLSTKLNLSINSNAYFHQHISQLVVEKVKSLLANETFMADPVHFAHLVDEAVEYENSRQKLDGGDFGINVFTALTTESVIKDWIQLENDTCISCVDDLLASQDRWKSRFRDFDDADAYKVCECADAFVSLINSLQIRTRLLPDVTSQRQFLDLQVLMVDDFLKRLAQIASKAESPWMEPFPHVMNAVWYICDILEDWNEVCLLSGIVSSGGSRVAFDSSIEMYKNRWNLMADDIGLSIRMQTLGAAYQYQQQRWGSMENSPLAQRDISAFFCPFMMLVRSAFANANNTISKASLPGLFKRMVSHVSFVLREKVLDCTSFNSEGGIQMLHDIEHGLIPILNNIFTRSGVDHLNAAYDKGMTHVIGSLKLLSLAWGNAILLREELENVSEEIAEEKLISMNIRSITLQDAQQLFRQRTDLDPSATSSINLR